MFRARGIHLPTHADRIRPKFRVDSFAASSTIGSVLLIGITVGLVAAAAVGIRPRADSASVNDLPLTAITDAQGLTIRLIHQARNDLDPSQFHAVISTSQGVAFSGQLAPASQTWKIGEALPLTMASALPWGSQVDITITSERTHAVVAMARVPIPFPSAASVAPLGSTLQLTANATGSPPEFKPATPLQLEATVNYPGGRKLIRYVYANLAAINGSSWEVLRDDGTGGDRFAADGIYSALLLVPGAAPDGVGNISAYAVDLDGNRVGATINVDVDRFEVLLSILDPTASKALRTSGSGCIRVAGHILVNSSASDSIHGSNTGCADSGPAAFVATGGSSIYTVGGYAANCCSPLPEPHAPIIDPLANVVMPYYSGGVWYVAGQAQPNRTIPGTGNVLDPGVYAGGIDLPGDWIMNPGIYIADGGKFGVGGSSSMRGEGVFVYVAASSGMCKGIAMSGGPTINLTAPTTGPYAGITIAQQRSCTAAATISGGSGIQLTGKLYAPSAALTLNGGNTMTLMRTAIIVNTLTVNGGGFSFMEP